ncbi:TetR/AcrR family transcriptional regulator [Phytohabitans suffuscus]|uniref:TetR family transcriptional regulator n=1 Tax=Phytohabitans suffuscus TaxID=624315 RepID=A0A6F8YGW0_9ACTN|nr:TetR/AcrR family transcriptional regulator [Phytohabitans suffuscus]BCB85249.1 TetR family transcriptional regulator [Phytohabitans suffuscus]
MTEKRSYHHGDLRRALLAAAAEAIAETGPAALSLRDLARRAGVSHAAPAHHFGDKAGLLTALAIEGFNRLADALDASREQTGSLLESGVTYVRFAADNRAHFEVMFQPSLYERDDPELVAARDRSAAALSSGVSTLDEPPPADEARKTELAAWSIVHGFATLWLSGAFFDELESDIGEAARPVIRRLFE